MSNTAEGLLPGEDDWRRERRWSVLDPAGEPKGTVFSSVYVTDELLVDDRVVGTEDFERLRNLAALNGWTLSDEDLEDPIVERGTAEPRRRSRGASSSSRARLSVAASQVAGTVGATPDAWRLLRQARHDGIDDGISLNHVLTTDDLGLNPFTANPFTANPFTANPFTTNALAVGIGSYASPGFGGRQPVTYLGPPPARTTAHRPLVAVFDTGCGTHDWFAYDVLVPPHLPGGEPIGIDQPATDPEANPSLALPLDGIFDDVAGHGTFIAGIVLQECPDAQILPVRVADGNGVILENELIGALGRLLCLMETSDVEQRRKVDVLNLSFSYYHETPDDPKTVSEVTSLLARIRDHGCVVVCSAGNEATDRPTFPAALEAAQPDRHLSVGALNPANHSVALFSNVGAWVKTWAPGVSILSTLPDTFEGGLQAGTHDDCHGHRRDTLDIDDFRGGFAVWSGTSFAAPVVSGKIAARIAAGLDPDAASQEVVAKLAAEDHSRLP